MPASSSMPIILRAGYALVRTARSLVPFARIFLLPWLLGTVVLIAAGAFRLNQFGWPIIWGHWIDDLLWAPFMAVIVVVTLRHFDGEKPPGWRKGVHLGRNFGWLIVVEFIFAYCTQFAYQLEGETVGLYLALQPADYWSGVSHDEPTQDLIAISYSARIASIALGALTFMLLSGMVWELAVNDRFEPRNYWRVLKQHFVRLLVYFTIFQLIIQKLGEYSSYPWQLLQRSELFPYWLYTALPSAWRELVAPAFLHQLTFLPSLYLVTLIALAATHEAYAPLLGTTRRASRANPGM
jgi:hypothetical protein